MIYISYWRLCYRHLWTRDRARLWDLPGIRQGWTFSHRWKICATKSYWQRTQMYRNHSRDALFGRKTLYVCVLEKFHIQSPGGRKHRERSWKMWKGIRYFIRGQGNQRGCERVILWVECTPITHWMGGRVCHLVLLCWLPLSSPVWSNGPLQIPVSWSLLSARCYVFRFR